MLIQQIRQIYRYVSEKFDIPPIIAIVPYQINRELLSISDEICWKRSLARKVDAFVATSSGCKRRFHEY